MFRGSAMAKWKSHCIARFPGFWTGNAAKVLVNPRNKPEVHGAEGSGGGSLTTPKDGPEGPAGCGAGGRVSPPPDPGQRGPSPAHHPKLRPPEANRPGASCWQRNLGNRPGWSSRGRLSSGAKKRHRRNRSGPIYPVYLFQLPDSGSGIFQPTARGSTPEGALRRWFQTPGFYGVPETVAEATLFPKDRTPTRCKFPPFQAPAGGKTKSELPLNGAFVRW